MPPAPAPDPCDLEAELRLVRGVQAKLEAAPAESLALLDDWARSCPRGALTEERLALRALALCASGARQQGATALLELRVRFPASPSLARVEGACAPP